MKKITIKNCVVCGREYSAYPKPGARGARTTAKRGFKSRTCSKKCSRDWTRIATHCQYIFGKTTKLMIKFLEAVNKTKTKVSEIRFISSKYIRPMKIYGAKICAEQ